MNTSHSQRLYNEAQKYMPGGVSSPVRAFRAVGGSPLFIQRGEGCRLYDIDGNKFIDYVCSWGPLILGHAHPSVVVAIKEAAERGTSYGAPTEAEVELAMLITSALPSVEMVRFVNSGTEATMSALRLARAYTRRDKIIKFDGCYHGHADGLLVKAGSGVATLGLPDSPGVPESYAQHTLVAPYNDLEAVARLLEANRGQVAAAIVEPIAANMGVVPPTPSFLEGLRQLTRDSGSLLIFDEVITGFRVGWSGAQGLYGISPDLTCLGKIIGGGLPVGAYGGRREIMEMVAPLGPVYQAGTLSGNPLAMAAGLATLRELHPVVSPAEPKEGVYKQLEERSARLAEGLQAAAREAGITVVGNRVGSVMTLFFTDQGVTDYASARTSDAQKYAAFFRAMLERGVYLAPSQFEAAFVSTAHAEADIEETVKAAEDAFREIRRL